jgi:ABC-type Fe3+ transport system substrate-binding protein
MVIAAAPPLTSSTSLQRVLEGASKEGKLHIWYSTPSEAKTWDALKEAFQKRFNLKVDLTRTFVFSTDQPARLAAEGRTRVLSADISQVSLSKQNVDLQKQLGLFEVTDWVGLFASVWPEIKEVVDFEPKLLRGYGLRLQDFVRGIVYNTRMIAEKDVPGTLEAYTQPKWHGNIVFGEPYMDPLPRLHSFPEWPLNRVVETGKAFLANKPLFPRGGVEATEFVARGETAVHLHSAWATYAKKKADGAPIGFKPFDKFVVVHGNAFTPLTTARNPNMARLFIAWYAMEGAQISEKMEYRSAVVHPGTQIKKIFDEVKRGRVVVTDNSLEDIERRNEYERALRKLVQR